MEKICVICDKVFECYDKKRRGWVARTRKKRIVNAVTCSDKCTKANYDRHKGKGVK